MDRLSAEDLKEERKKPSNLRVSRSDGVTREEPR